MFEENDEYTEIFGDNPLLITHEYFDGDLPFGTLVLGSSVPDQLDNIFRDIYAIGVQKDYYIALGCHNFFMPVAGAVKLFKHFIDRQIICKIKQQKEEIGLDIDFEAFRLQPVHCVRLYKNLEVIMTPAQQFTIAGFVDVQKLTNTVFCLALIISSYLCYENREFFERHYGKIVNGEVSKLSIKSHDYLLLRDGVVGKHFDMFETEKMAEMVAVTCETFFNVNFDDGFTAETRRQIGTAMTDKEPLINDISVMDAVSQPCHIVETIVARYRIPVFYITLGEGKLLRINDDFTGFCYRDTDLSIKQLNKDTGFLHKTIEADDLNLNVTWPASMMDMAYYGGSELNRLNVLENRLKLFRFWLAEQGLFRKDNKSILDSWSPMPTKIAEQPLHVFAIQHEDFIGTCSDVYMTTGNGNCLKIDRINRRFVLANNELVLTDSIFPKSIALIDLKSISNVFIPSTDYEHIEYEKATAKGKIKLLNKKLEDYLEGIKYVGDSDFEDEIDKKLEKLTSEQLEAILEAKDFPPNLFGEDDQDDNFPELEIEDDEDTENDEDDDNEDC